MAAGAGAPGQRRALWLAVRPAHVDHLIPESVQLGSGRFSCIWPRQAFQVAVRLCTVLASPGRSMAGTGRWVVLRGGGACCCAGAALLAVLMACSLRRVVWGSSAAIGDRLHRCMQCPVGQQRCFCPWQAQVNAVSCGAAVPVLRAVQPHAYHVPQCWGTDVAMPGRGYTASWHCDNSHGLLHVSVPAERCWLAAQVLAAALWQSGSGEVEAEAAGALHSTR